eukprot:scaffold81841_cov46-Phaeocystis_antarctica.AAC.2
MQPVSIPDGQRRPAAARTPREPPPRGRISMDTTRTGSAAQSSEGRRGRSAEADRPTPGPPVGSVVVGPATGRVAGWVAS